MRIIRVATDKKVDDIENAILDAIQFFFGYHLQRVSFEIERRMDRKGARTLLVKYVINLPSGNKSGRLPQITIYDEKEYKAVVIPDEPALATAIAFGLSKIADSIDVNIGVFKPRKGVTENGKMFNVESPHPINSTVRDVMTKIIVENKKIPLVFSVALTYGTYLIVYYLNPEKIDDPLEAIRVVLEVIYADDIIEVGVGAGEVGKVVSKVPEDYVIVDEEFVEVKEV